MLLTIMGFQLSTVWIYLNLLSTLYLSFALKLGKIQQSDIFQASLQHCLIIIPQSLVDERALDVLTSIQEQSFKDDPAVAFYSTYATGNDAKSSINVDFTNSFLIFKRVRKDRTCLLAPPSPSLPEQILYSFEGEGYYEKKNIVDFINNYCHTFRQTNGNLTPQGLHQEYILNNLYSIPREISNQDALEIEKKDNSFCELRHGSPKSDGCSTQKKGDEIKEIHSVYQSKRNSVSSKQMQKCERIEMPTSSTFFNDYLLASKPVVITGAASHWPVFKKWTNNFFLDKYGDARVHIKITPNGEYEGVEPIHLWENKSKIKIPKDVLNQLPFPDLVVVRPATMQMKFADFIRLIEQISSSKTSNISAYLEYSSISNFDNLKEDIDEMNFVKSILNLKHTNVWLSDGNTVGKLHFDPFDNLMCQISGEKEFVIYAPHANERLYEAHIQEAVLSYNTSSKSFFRENLLESTSMVMSPVDIEKPDLKRFPRFAEATPLSCTIQPGDVLFTPAFWWHEVRSKPNSTEGRNLAVNFWYEPFFQKEFPCPDCRLYINPEYLHLL